MTPLPSKQWANVRSDHTQHFLSHSKQAKLINGLRDKKTLTVSSGWALSVDCTSWEQRDIKQLSGKPKLLWSTLSSHLASRSGVFWLLALLKAFLFWGWSYLKLILDLSSSYLHWTEWLKICAWWCSTLLNQHYQLSCLQDKMKKGEEQSSRVTIQLV